MNSATLSDLMIYGLFEEFLPFLIFQKIPKIGHERFRRKRRNRSWPEGECWAQEVNSYNQEIHSYSQEINSNNQIHIIYDDGRTDDDGRRRRTDDGLNDGWTDDDDDDDGRTDGPCVLYIILSDEFHG